MKRIIITGILILAAGLCLAPVLFLLVGTFMGNHEIYTCIAPALGKGDGLAIWHLLPQYPTLQNVVELLFDSPEYFQMFWNSIFYTGAILAGQMLFGMPAAWGLARYSFRGRKTVYRLFILVMMMPFQVTMLSQYLVLNRLGMLDRPRQSFCPEFLQRFPSLLCTAFSVEYRKMSWRRHVWTGRENSRFFCGSAYRLEVRASCRHWYFRFWTVLAC